MQNFGAAAAACTRTRPFLLQWLHCGQVTRPSRRGGEYRGHRKQATNERTSKGADDGRKEGGREVGRPCIACDVMTGDMEMRLS